MNCAQGKLTFLPLIILNKESCEGGMDWCNLAEGKDRWRILVNTVMNLRVVYSVGYFFTIRVTIGFSIWTLAPWNYLY
jgi:hypothetical protein